MKGTNKKIALITLLLAGSVLLVGQANAKADDVWGLWFIEEMTNTITKGPDAMKDEADKEKRKENREKKQNKERKKLDQIRKWEQEYNAQHRSKVTSLISKPTQDGIINIQPQNRVIVMPAQNGVANPAHIEKWKH